MDRKKGIGGTDASAIVGMHPFKTILDVWLDKTEQSEPQEDNENMWWGREMEPVLAKRYEKETGIKLFIPPVDDLPYAKFNGRDPIWYIGSPDALVVQGDITEGGVDFKTSGKPDEWGEPGTDEVPQHYLIQAEWYMGLTGAQWWDIAVLLMGFTRKFAIYRINRDDELIEGLTEAGAKFWQDHVLANVPPPLDGSKSATEYLKRKYPQDSGPMLEPTDKEIINEILRYKFLKQNLKAWEEDVTEKENKLKAIIGDCAGMQGEWGKITWRRSKDSETVDWKNAFDMLAGMVGAGMNERLVSIKQNTKIKPGSRRWLPKFKED